MAFGLQTLAPRETIVGLDVGDGVAAAALVAPGTKGVVTVARLGCVRYDPDAPDRDVAQAIRGLWREFRIPTYTVCSCLRSPSLTLRHFRYPKIARRELDSALQLEAEETLQSPHAQLLIDCHVNHIEHAEGGRTDECGIEGTLVAAPRDVVERHIHLLKMAGLYPVIVDVSAMAVGNLFLRMRADWMKGAACVVNLSGRTADIAVLYDGSRIYPKVVASRSGTWADSTDYLVTNLKDGLKYYEFKLRHVPVENLVFTGDVPDPERFLKRVRREIGLPVELWNPLRDMKLPSGRKTRLLLEDDRKGPLLTACLGLALRGE